MFLSQSARRLAQSTYSRVVETLELSDHRRPDQQMDSIVRSRPDLVVLAGGTDGGAARSIEKMLEAVGLACYLTPMEKRPMVLYAGNQKLAHEVQELLGGHAGKLQISPNVRPSLETEDLAPAMYELASLVMSLRQRQIKGVDELSIWASGNIMPTAYAQGRMIRFLSKLYDSTRGLLSVNVGASATSVAAGFAGELTLGVYPQYGLGENLAGILQYTEIDDIMRWLPLDLSSEYGAGVFISEGVISLIDPCDKRGTGDCASDRTSGSISGCTNRAKGFPGQCAGCP